MNFCDAHESRISLQLHGAKDLYHFTYEQQSNLGADDLPKYQRSQEIILILFNESHRTMREPMSWHERTITHATIIHNCDAHEHAYFIILNTKYCFICIVLCRYTFRSY